MEARAVVIAAEVVAREREVGVGVRAVDEDGDAFRPRHVDDPTHRRDVACHEADVHDLDDSRARRDRLGHAADVFVGALGRRVLPNGFDDDPVASLALAPRRLHARVVLRRDDDLVAALEVEPQNHRLVRLRRVARDRHLLGVAAEVARELATHALDARLEHAPHVLHRQLVREAEVADHLLENVRRRRAAAAVVEIDHRAIEIERALDLRPVGFVLGDGLRPRQSAERVAAHDRELGERQRGACADEGADESAAIGHGMVLGDGTNCRS